MSEDNGMIQCPYNSSHFVQKHRMALHLIKCRQQHATEKFVSCPFNRTHDVPAPEIEYHTKTCPDRKTLENRIYVIEDPKPEVEQPANIEIPSCSENWDEEAGTSASYLDVKNEIVEKKKVFRTPVGMSKNSRKAFFKSEVRRFESSSE